MARLPFCRANRGFRTRDTDVQDRCSDLDWVPLGKGMGGPGIRATSLDASGKALQAGLEGEGPTLIEVPAWITSSERR